MTEEQAAGAVAPLRCAFAHASPTVQLLLPLALPAGATARDARAAARAWLLAASQAEPVPVPAGGVLDVAEAARLAAGSAARAALAEIAWEGGECAIFGQAAQWASPLRDGDRVELLRPLRADPRASRRDRVAEARRRAARPAAARGGSGGG